MKHPRRFYQPLADGAPMPIRELPVRLERMIHFVPPHIEKIRAKIKDIIGEVDVVPAGHRFSVYLGEERPADALVRRRGASRADARRADEGVRPSSA